MIIVKLEDLKKKINELESDQHDYIEISILDEDKFNGHVIPKTIHFHALNGLGGSVDYESIEHVEIDPFYKN